MKRQDDWVFFIVNDEGKMYKTSSGKVAWHRLSDAKLALKYANYSSEEYSIIGRHFDDILNEI